MIGTDSIHRSYQEYTGKTDLDRKNAVRQILQDDTELNQAFENVTLAWCNPQSTLVPSSVFSETTAQEIIKLCFGSDAALSSIDHNRIYEMSAVNVYTIPDWVKSVMVLKYPQIIMQHAGTHHVRNVLHSDAFYTKVTIVVFPEYFQLTIVKHNKLEFYASFDYQTSEDIVYHVNFVLQQKELLNEKGSIELGAIGLINEDVVTQIEQSMSSLKHLNQMKFEQLPDYLFKSQLLCV
jgi:hypothetical protein